jgi:UDP-N-acetylmuramate--alanine ligase
MKTSVFLGIGGAGMKGLAYLLRESRENVIGFDNNSELSDVSLEEAVEALSTADRLVYTDAAISTHPLREAALEASITQVPYQEALGDFSRQYTTIAITGTHGKSSTTAFLAHICIQAGLDPSVLVGASMPSLRGHHAQLGKSKYFIVEADEYRKHFLELSPVHIVITTIDFDHPDAFSSIQDVEKAYEEFMQKLPMNGLVVLPEKEKLAHPTMSFPANTISLSEKATASIEVSLPGQHMRMNAALAVTIAESLGVPKQIAIDSLRSFPGLSRRFELLGTANGCDIRSDYGHHPAEIAATITGAREVYPDSHITAVFEAHMPLRLHTFFDDFVSALATADEVVIVPPFVPAGRDTTATEDALQLQEKLLAAGKKATYSENPTDFLSHLSKNTIILLFSAGSLDSIVRKSLIEG